VTIKLENIGKKFRNEWIFKDVNYVFKAGNKYAITGFNGSGKSTLIQVISGLIPTNLGKVRYKLEDNEIPEDEVYKHLFITAPYIDLIEEYSLSEALDFHFKFKPLQSGLDKEGFLKLIFLESHVNKPIKQFSSGMKQRLKLGLAFTTGAKAIFLDEPTTNLDQQGIDWYLNMVSNVEESKLVIISSNDKREYQFCDEVLAVDDFKLA